MCLEEFYEVAACGGADRKVHVPIPKARVGGHDDLVLQPSSPGLGDQWVDLAGRGQFDQGHRPGKPRRDPAGSLKLPLHLILGRAQNGCLGIGAGQNVLRPAGLQEQVKGRLGIA
jgi:hypothetical protein